MANVSLNQYAQVLGAATVIGMAQKVGLKPPPPTISVRNLIAMSARFMVPLAPVDLQPANGATGISNNPYLSFRDPGAGGPAAAGEFDFAVTQNNYLVDPSRQLTGGAVTHSPLTPPGVKWFYQLPPGQVTLTVFGKNNNGNGPSSSSTFTVISTTTPPTPLVIPTITVNYKSGFVVTGSKFAPNKQVTIRVVDDGDPAHYVDYYANSDGKGSFTTTLSIPCNSGYNLHFSATDLRANNQDLTGDLWSNTVTTKCP